MRKLLALVLLGAALLGGGILLGGHHGHPAAARVPADAVAMDGSADPGPEPSSTSTTSSTEDRTDAPSSPWLGPSDNARSKSDYYAQLNDPTRSDLPVETARALDDLGARLLRADATGEGRDAFAGYWGGTGQGDRGPCCRNLVIHASSAARYGGRDDVAQVAVIWSADRIGGEHVSEETTVLYFARQVSSWHPLHQWELPQ